MKKILAVFTCFNRKEKTLNCLKSLNSNNVKISFIAVDDNSDDGTYESLSLYPDVQVIRGDGNCFYSGGMRLGIAAAQKRLNEQFDYVMFFNDDVEFYPNAIDRLVQFENNRNEITVGAVCDDEGHLSYGGALVNKKYKPEYINVMSESSNRVYCDTFCANCVLIPVSIFERLPNIDVAYLHAMGDFDYGHTAARLGYKITVSDFFVGVCNDNPITNTWRDTSLKRSVRIKKKESVKGLPFYPYYHFLYKNHGFVKAVVYSITPYLRILFKR